VPDVAARDQRLVLSLAAVVTLAAWEARVSSASPAWTAQHFSTGAGFHHTLAVGDLNGDGFLDIAIPNSATSAVTVLLGNGDGTLAPHQTHAALGQPQDVQMADLTGDGLLDLATPDYAGSGVAVLRGLGNGTFAPPVAYPTGPGLVSLAVVDLDGDARLDLAVTKEAGSSIAVLPALAAGGFGTAVQVATGAIPHQINTADLDHDGRPDLIVANHGAAAASVHLGNGTFMPGAATPFPAGAAPIGLTVADLNLDGDADLLVSNVNAATVSVLLGNGDGTFASPVAYPTDPRPRGMDAGDLDGDGVPEVVIATGYPDGDSVLTIYRGRADGTLEIFAHFDLPYRAADCVVADLNGDGHRDIVVAGPQAGVVSVLLNPGGTLGVPDAPAVATHSQLRVAPNPARSSVTFRFLSPAGAGATLEILDLAGRRVARLGTFSDGPDWRSATWRSELGSGERAAPGLYLVRLSSGDDVVTRRVMLLPR